MPQYVGGGEKQWSELVIEGENVMTYEKDPFEYQGIPDYALQPAKEAEEYNFHYVPRGVTSRFDPAAYERVLHESAKQAAESDEFSELLFVHGKEPSVPYQTEQTPVSSFPQPMGEGFQPAQLAAYYGADAGQYRAVPDSKEAFGAFEAVAGDQGPMETVGVQGPMEISGAQTAMEAAGEQGSEQFAEVQQAVADIYEAAQAEADYEPEKAEAIQETAQVEAVYEPAQAEAIQETAQVEAVQETAGAAPAEEVRESAEATAQEPIEIAEAREAAQADFGVSESVKEKAVAELWKKKDDAVPVFAPPPKPAAQPVFVPKTVPAKITPVATNVMSSKLRLVDLKRKPPVRIFIEEDILVPDVKPDLAYILSMDGKVKLMEREIHTGQTGTDSVRLLGDLILQTLYIPEQTAAGDPIVAIESKIPFKNETEIKAGPYADLVITPNIESIDYTVVNERKIRVRASVSFGIKEYGKVDVEVFEGVRNEELQMLKEKITLTDVAMRKTEVIDVKDEFMLKENMPEILKVLKYDVSVVENHKQITREKAVINASVYCNVLYLGAEETSGTEQSDGVSLASVSDAAIPVLYQGKTEFTQFIKLDGDGNPGDQSPAGSKVGFHVASLNLAVKEDGNGKRNLLALDMNVDTELELYKNVEKEFVTDVYHHLKDVEFETDEVETMSLGGSGVAEISAREIVNIPEKYGNVDQIVYISGNVSEKRSFIDQTKCVVEGVVNVNLICTSANSGKTVFNIAQEIPFRSAMEIPGITPDMTANNDIVLKELWFDKINNKQIEVNAGILVNTAVSGQRKHQLVKNVSFLESPQDRAPLPGIVLYISRTGDSIWNIAKKYRTTIDELKTINDLETAKEIKPGTKLLIVAKNH